MEQKAADSEGALNVLQEARTTISEDFLKNAHKESFSNKVQAVSKNKSGHTK